MHWESPEMVNWLTNQFPQLQDIQPLSKGGQKFVFSAVDSQEGEVVLKVMKPDSDIEQTKREVLAVSNIQSDRVPKITKHGMIGSCFWFLEQRIHGKIVRDLLVNETLSKENLLRMALHVSETLVAAEAAKIVHRDIKPDNIIRDQNGHFWLIDFGLARHLDLNSLTATADPFGKLTIGYAPLEQFQNIKIEIDTRADLFALGVTLYECATGENPLRVNARDFREVIDRLNKLNRLQLSPLSHLSFSSDASFSNFSDLISTLTQQKRIRRPSTAQETYEWIKEICIQENVQ